MQFVIVLLVLACILYCVQCAPHIIPELVEGSAGTAEQVVGDPDVIIQKIEFPGDVTQKALMYPDEEKIQEIRTMMSKAR